VSWLLDTNVVSEVIRPKPNDAVLAWLAERSGDEARLYLSALTLAEIQRGVLRLDPKSQLFARLHAWLNTGLAKRFAGRILAFDEQVARTWGAMTAALPRGTVVSTMDSLIGATALHHGLILVTRNVNHLRHFGRLAVENPWH
jgi:predicted nucleic acid-binding protein